jgi:hypothetical protein
MDWQCFTERSRNKRLVAKGGKVNIGVGHARRLVEACDPLGPAWDALADLAAPYLPAIRQEIAELDTARERNWQRLARRAIVFGLASPRRDVDTAIDVAVWVERWLEQGNAFADEQIAIDVCRYYTHRDGRMLSLTNYKQLGERLYACRDFLANPDRELFTVPYLESLFGAGPKVARMILAVANPHMNVFTVDMWHARQLLATAGEEYCKSAGIDGKPAYDVIEPVFLDWAQRMFPTEIAWARQWALWCAAFGEFKSHRHLWHDLAGSG